MTEPSGSSRPPSCTGATWAWRYTWQAWPSPPEPIWRTSRLRDAAPLRAFRGEYGKAARTGLLLHTGTAIEWLAPDVLAVPWWRVC